ncbi:peptidase domain-containing ABC transporter [Bacillus atrophaeus]|uniref:peptidase domain-containing ABC transporter n=1 Tax=Bacillus atrophaeus TaxID=1452 RepID=UPI0022800673|nr:peptidase domain-containing ABC transporter [Bacillus atrophaeus]MCY8913314.1 peptidase domain-containing ABC transporter [Bacillus atrophaeus]MCY8915161.1 peptidase domain-containing ABC transporter [Bacillus atrophaeus]MCY8924803.1 peptidase domain-containing ABC transporter [Bacillus atrophaeus]MCY9113728.1 peptidase domain-containing ABC transporter [Bacillus atrophaeus]MEC0925962.1 peptidase domain-containing ABC transporter [Bacillus atrophaeus]
MKIFSEIKKRRLTPTLQLAQSECGLCCVKTILEAYDYQISLSELRQVKEPGRDGLGFQQLKKLLSHFGMNAKTYRIKDTRALKVINCPIIAFWKGYHFVCVESYNEHEVIIMDPSIGRIKITQSEFLDNFQEYVLTAEPGIDFKKRSVSNLSKWRKKYIWPSNMIGLYLKIALMSIVLVGITLAIPIFTQILIDKGFGDVNSFATILGSLLIALIIMVILNFLRTYFSIKIIYRFSWHLLSSAFTRVLSLPAKYFTVRAPGEIIYRLNSLTRIQDVLGTTLVQACLDLVSGLSILVYVFWISPLLGIMILLFTLSTFAFLIIAQSYVNSATDKELHEGTNAQSIQLDAIVSINSVKLGGYVQSYINDWEQRFKKFLNATSHRMRLQQGIIGSILSGIQVFAPLIILVTGIFMAELGLMTLGQAIAVQSIAALLFVYVNSVFTIASEALVAVRYIVLAEDIFEYPIEYSRKDPKEMASGAVCIENLSFSYTSDSIPAIKNINLDISDGETIALVGLSGSGKTTLGKVISSLFEPTSGSIYFGGVEYHEYNLDTLRDSISYIPQEAHLHNRTIMENLKLGSKRTETEIREFCDLLDFMDFINKFPMGYNTVISETGANLSGGQRQRIHIARVLLQTPKLLIMDEATSSLDNISQSYVYDALSKLECTKIVIAHRLETILNADRIVVLENGCIVQSGSHEELINIGGLYAKLFGAELEKERVENAIGST